MTDATNDRKIEHIEVIQSDPYTDRQGSYFDRLKLTHRALPGIALNQVDTSCDFLAKKLSFPLLISSMTGGDHQLIRKINRHLAEAAEHCQVALAVGSQRVMFSSEAAQQSFKLRQFAPSTVLLGNIGAVQLNKGFDITQAQAAVDILQADGLYLHLNALQEAIQAEGDTDFSDLHLKIQSIVSQLDKPVLLKEVGSGFSLADLKQGMAAGVKYFDVSGKGGTSWSRIEHHRNQRRDPAIAVSAENPLSGNDLGLCFQDWGIDTVTSLQMLNSYTDSVTLISSGGIRNGIDMLKSVILGASICGVAAPFLKPAMHSTEAVIVEIERLHKEFKTAMFLLGMKDIKSLFKNNSLLLEER
ncbi:type 2 isopentenyl-diphosphate Delta-isomerase ['Osedax' symbiont bacterium Rs2_46_30_T18]|nr:type 2 isopentenyl-diphosphate Delta-isomerase ['Osedax' symbiont bacterium Rs2_46_30_T18]